MQTGVTGGSRWPKDHPQITLKLPGHSYTQPIHLKSYGKSRIGIPLYQTVNFSDEFALCSEYQRNKTNKIVSEK